jgi:putative transposase
VQGINTALIEPGKLWLNAIAESFNGKLRDECLSADAAKAKPIIKRWRRHYSKVSRVAPREWGLSIEGSWALG